MERVTNEQARADRDCDNLCDECIHREGGCRCGEITIDEYASDLLDARAERDKAIAMVKEMRAVLTNCVGHLQGHTEDQCKAEDSGYDVLERTKDYA